MADRTPYQDNVVRRYYDRRDEIMLTKLGELVTELYLAGSDRKRDELWRRVEKAIKALNVPTDQAQHTVSRRDIEVLARNVRAWLEDAKKPPNQARAEG